MSNKTECSMCHYIFKNCNMGKKTNGEYYKTCPICRKYHYIFLRNQKKYKNENLMSVMRCYFCGEIKEIYEMNIRYGICYTLGYTHRCQKCAKIIKKERKALLLL